MENKFQENVLPWQTVFEGNAWKLILFEPLVISFVLANSVECMLFL